MPEFPVHVILDLKSKSQVTKIQVLGHTYMIPQRVVLYGGDFSNKFEKKIWKKIGYITFNENASGKHRELKTINLHEFNIQAQYLKFEVHECFNNRRNLFNKVAIEGKV